MAQKHMIFPEMSQFSQCSVTLFSNHLCLNVTSALFLLPGLRLKEKKGWHHWN